MVRHKYTTREMVGALVETETQRFAVDTMMIDSLQRIYDRLSRIETILAIDFGDLQPKRRQKPN